MTDGAPAGRPMARRVPSPGVAFEDFPSLHRAVAGCRRCPRLIDHCRRVAETRRKAYALQMYWGRPVSGFGDAAARLWIIGLAPGAHGANRTGRVFTGDRSGDFLYAALHRAGLANQPHSVSRDDGLILRDVYVSVAARCAPPGNKPLPDELANCAGYLSAEWDLLTRKRVILALGRVAWDSAVRMIRARTGAQRAPEFSHAGEWPAPGVFLVGSYHVSQQNTFTGRLTPAGFDAVLGRAVARCAG